MLITSNLQELCDICLAPAPEPSVRVIAQTRGVPAIKKRAGQELLVCLTQPLFIECQTAWRMTAPTVPSALNQISATIPLCVLLSVLGESAWLGKERVPHCYRPAHVKRPGNFTWHIGDLGRTHTLHEEGI
ncbi:hypothetical protein SAMN05216264_11871 [Pseudomonas marincola]|nr:hypothetical protein SAMN05216264_11871 [Pseudomonas marincola]